MALLVRLAHWICGIWIITPSVLIAAEAPLYEFAVTKYMMGTVVEVTVLTPDVAEAKSALVAAFRETERIEHLLNVHDSTSEISAINAAAGHAPVRVSWETFAILERSRSYSEKFRGIFDITIGPLIELWGFNGDAPPRAPRDEQIRNVLPLVGYRKVHLSAADTTVFLPKRGMRVDLGGIAKGYAIDRLAAVLRAWEINDFFINAGGDIFASGTKADQSQWQVGIKDPRRPDSVVAAFALCDFAVATSGDYERYFINDGKRFCHILDPANGYPGRMCQSVSVLASTAEEADVLATYLFLIGHLKNTSATDKIPAYVIVDAGGTLHYDANLHETNKLRLAR